MKSFRTAGARFRIQDIINVVILFVLAGAPSLLRADVEPQVFDAGKVDSLPVPLTQAHPNYPPDLKEKGIEGRAMIEFIVMPDGTVASAHATQSTQPEFAASAVAAVNQWTFKPALRGGKPVAMHWAVPMVFSLQPALAPIQFEVGAPQESFDMRTGARSIVVPFREVSGAAPPQVYAARFIISHAEDDTGTALQLGGGSAFHLTSVGSVAGDSSDKTSRQPITLTLMGAAKDAKMLKIAEGKMEVFAPSADPDATVVVDHVAAHMGVPLDSPALKNAGVDLILYDQANGNKMAADKAQGGPQEYDGGPMFGADYVDPDMPPAVAQGMREAQKHVYDSYPPALAARLKKANELSATDIAVGIHDPAHRLVALEFQAADGSPIPYNHNGHYHAERTRENKRLDVYDLRAPLAPDAKLICWILTANSVMPLPLKLADLPLPAPRSAPTSPPRPAAIPPSPTTSPH